MRYAELRRELARLSPEWADRDPPLHLDRQQRRARVGRQRPQRICCGLRDRGDGCCRCVADERSPRAPSTTKDEGPMAGRVPRREGSVTRGGSAT